MEEINGYNADEYSAPCETVTDDIFAEKVLIRRAKKIEERDRLIADCKAMLEYYNERIESIEEQYKSGIEYDEGLLYAYAMMSHLNETATQKTYKLPSGKLVITKAKKDYSPDKEKMLEYFKKNRPELVKVKEEPDWASFKKELTISGDSIINTATGEEIDCVSIIDKPESFKIS